MQAIAPAEDLQRPRREVGDDGGGWRAIGCERRLGEAPLPVRAERRGDLWERPLNGVRSVAQQRGGWRVVGGERPSLRRGPVSARRGRGGRGRATSGQGRTMKRRGGGEDTGGGAGRRVLSLPPHTLPRTIRPPSADVFGGEYRFPVNVPCDGVRRAAGGHSRRAEAVLDFRGRPRTVNKIVIGAGELIAGSARSSEEWRSGARSGTRRRSLPAVGRE
eukprot:scaffold23011_cov126-Isochrysis_galbana.AAC.6